ncbi:E3 ubiquitin-protein ligase parkin isoform X1 [Chrysoperla carnea]|uniref:E3 ubiquitin-protein ligase parkin isoform X1 n=1 Tax=Chrysoperla carnea TaxID=189513 RepID=UPI001D0711E9|nr:E3 ubiquitin-protein ligase parkin isoform X1 [Chrysoperla carnea]
MSFVLNVLRSIIHNMLQLLWFGKKSISNSLSIYIKSNTGSTISVDLDPKWDIEKVKEIVAPQLGLQPEEVKIIFAGKELCDSTIIEECDLGEKSILHAVKARPKRNKKQLNTPSTLGEEVEETGSKPLNETLIDLQLNSEERSHVNTDEERLRTKAHFFVYCGVCKGMKPGKLRVRCEICKSGAFTVDSDPQCWDDVLEPKRITGECESDHENVFTQESSTSTLNNVIYAQFYFKCSEHTSQGESDQAVPLYLIKPNLHDVPCIACTDISDPVLVFPCEQNHVTCIDCFRQYCGSRLRDRQFWPHDTLGYTLECPAGCPNSYIKETHHFRLMSEVQYVQYQRFATEEYVLRQGGVLCPQPGCGMGILLEQDCQRIVCGNCGYSWDRNANPNLENGIEGMGVLWPGVNPNNAARGRWIGNNKADSSSATTKTCPKCGVATERDGGCMHMICARGSCKFQWCWVCHAAWTRECMASHWFD